MDRTRTSLVWLVSALLTACTTQQFRDFVTPAGQSHDQQVDAALQSLSTRIHAMEGKPLDAAIARMGYPTSKMVVGDQVVYAWTLDEVHTTYGVGTTEAQCTVKVATDSAGTIVHTDYTGNRIGCTEFQRAMR